MKVKLVQMINKLKIIRRKKPFLKNFASIKLTIVNKNILSIRNYFLIHFKIIIKNKRQEKYLRFRNIQQKCWHKNKKDFILKELSNICINTKVNWEKISRIEIKNTALRVFFSSSISHYKISKWYILQIMSK